MKINKPLLNIYSRYFIRIIFLLLILTTANPSLIRAEDKAKATYDFINMELLNPVFQKLYELETSGTGKINIVHIGDSHVQADFFPDAIRYNLQSIFGNGGYGFTFPYSLAKTNGTRHVRYKSNMEWRSARNVFPVADIEIGLSGIGLHINSNDFYIELTTDNQYEFNTIKVLYPTKEPCFNLTLFGDSLISILGRQHAPAKKTYYKVKSGDTLYRIASKYSVSVESIKRANKLRTDNINSGQTLLIPDRGTNQQIVTNKPLKQLVVKDTLPLYDDLFMSVYNSAEVLDKIFILPNKKYQEYNLNGIILENDLPGLIYHTIGVNGTKAWDYNKFPIFFEQLNILTPDLIIISLGTNESFNKVTVSEYMSEMRRMIENIRSKNIGCPILIMSPPPSLLRRKIPNTLAENYSKALLQIKDCIVWDLFAKMGGVSAPTRKENIPLIARDKVHYTKEGYLLQGNLFSSDFLLAYENYKKNIR